jgi:large subunit ribosomal protein L18
MAKGPNYRVPVRRRREAKTDYRQRLKLLKSGKPRFVVRKTTRRIITQVICYREGGDTTEAMATSDELRKFGYSGSTSNTPAAYLTGLLCGLRAIQKGFEEAILDMGLQRPTRGNRVYAALRGALEAGLDIPHNPEILPDDSRIYGEHISEDMREVVENVKRKIIESFGGAE